MKRILILTIDFPPRRGGVARYLGGLAKYWSDQLFVIAEPEVGDKEFDAQCGYRVVRHKLMLKRLWPRWAKMVWYLVKYRNEYDQIWVSHVIPVGTATLFAKWFLRKELIVFLHGMDFELARVNPRKRQIAKRVLDSAKLVVCNSEALRNRVKNFTKSETLTVYPTFNVEMFKKVERKSKPGLTILLTVGRLVGRKGHYRVLDAMIQMAKEGSLDGLVYLVVGSGMELPSLIRYTNKLGLDKHVRFYPNVEDKDLPRYYAAADIFIMPTEGSQTDIEGFGIVYHEAGYAGLPVIASKLPGVDEAVINGQTGVLVEPGNVSELKAVIENLINHPELRDQYGRAARQRIEREFSLQAQAEKLRPYL